MIVLPPRTSFSLLLVSLLGSASALSGAAPAKVSFNRDIRPIMSDTCFHCHGFDAKTREAGMRLDLREEALKPTRTAARPIVPGQPGESEIIRRIFDAGDPMPPADAHKTLTPEQKELFRRWVAEGATYEKHWAFVPPVRAPLPKTNAAKWPRTALDHFVLARLEAEKIAPAPAAAPETWLRRASFDLIGLPPTPAELDAFTADVKKRGDAAFTAAADRLLASPHYGERQAIEWLDAARYADTHGFNNDSSRSMWRWRDWVIDAFNANLPYDRFITEQIAGDLLPAPTLEQRIATGFARNHVISSEGGIIDEEYRLEYVADRVRTLSTAWLGLTMECAKCHDHKFDPIPTRDYYALAGILRSSEPLAGASRRHFAKWTQGLQPLAGHEVLFTDDDLLAQAAREIRVHGQSQRYTHTRVGVGGRMDTLQCAVVLAKQEGHLLSDADDACDAALQDVPALNHRHRVRTVAHQITQQCNLGGAVFIRVRQAGLKGLNIGVDV